MARNITERKAMIIQLKVVKMYYITESFVKQLILQSLYDTYKENLILFLKQLLNFTL